MQKQAATIPFAPPATGRAAAEQTTLAILIALSASHMMNDTMQSVIQALYPMFRIQYHLDYGQIGLITLAFQLTASILQPLVGLYADKRPLPYSLAVGMGSTFLGLVLLSRVDSFGEIVAAAAMVSRRRCSRSAATPARRWARCWRRSWWCRKASAVSPGSR